MKNKKFDKILIIDDDDINNYVTTKFIDKIKIGKEVDTVLNGSNALDYIEECDSNKKGFPDLIIVDICMPIMDGLEFLDVYDKKYYSSHKNTKLVVITASIRKDDEERALKHKCISGFMQKPINAENLAELLTN